MISYDTPNVVRWKGQYIQQKALGGGMYWESSGDKPGNESLIATVCKLCTSTRQKLISRNSLLTKLADRLSLIRARIYSVTRHLSMTTWKPGFLPAKCTTHGTERIYIDSSLCASGFIITQSTASYLSSLSLTICTDFYSLAVCGIQCNGSGIVSCAWRSSHGRCGRWGCLPGRISIVLSPAWSSRKILPHSLQIAMRLGCSYSVLLLHKSVNHIKRTTVKVLVPPVLGRVYIYF